MYCSHARVCTGIESTMTPSISNTERVRAQEIRRAPFDSYAKPVVAVRISIHNDQPPSERLYEEFDSNNTLARLRALVSRVRRKGFDELDPAKNPLVPRGHGNRCGSCYQKRLRRLRSRVEAEEHSQWPPGRRRNRRYPCAHPRGASRAFELRHLGRYGRFGRRQIDVQRGWPAEAGPALLRSRLDGSGSSSTSSKT